MSEKYVFISILALFLVAVLIRAIYKKKQKQRLNQTQEQSSQPIQKTEEKFTARIMEFGPELKPKTHVFYFIEYSFDGRNYQPLMRFSEKDNEWSEKLFGWDAMYFHKPFVNNLTPVTLEKYMAEEKVKETKLLAEIQRKKVTPIYEKGRGD